MSPDELPPPVLIEDQASFEDLLQELERHDEVAIDTEADSFYSYREKVCLVQITAGGQDYLVDPLSDVDLAPMGELLAREDCTKVFHDGEYDVMILKRDYGFEFRSLFDTRVAAACLGSTTPGLASVLSEVFDVELDKSMQRSDWAQRPLSEKQIRYARLDTHFLLELMHHQIDALATAGRRAIVETECRRLEALDSPAVEFSADDFVRVKGVRELSPRARRNARELFAMRDRLAQEWDVPPFRVMHNNVLLEIARRAPRDGEGLGQIKGFTPKMGRRLTKPVLQTLRQARPMEPIKRLPSLPRRDGTAGLDEEQVEFFDRLKAWRKSVAEELEIESSYLLNRRVMTLLATQQPTELAQLEEIDELADWQLERFGEGLLRVGRKFAADREAGKLGKRRGWRR